MHTLCCLVRAVCVSGGRIPRFSEEAIALGHVEPISGSIRMQFSLFFVWFSDNQILKNNIKIMFFDNFIWILLDFIRFLKKKMKNIFGHFWQFFDNI